jgi:hypothetical protein
VGIAALPTVGEIQRTTIVAAVLCAIVLLAGVSVASATSCILGAALMVANLSALSWTVQMTFGLAHQAGGATALGLIVAPLKMLLLAAIVFWIIESQRVNVAGFIAGTLTQFVAIFIEIGRASIWSGTRSS